jgi:hypothetical protein
MRKNHLATVALAMALGPGLVLSACGSKLGASSGTGGATGTGGASGGISGAGGAGASCSNVTACGGNLVGTWAVTSSCLTVSGTLDPSVVGAGCTSAPITGSLQVSGTWTAAGDGTYTDDTVTTGTEQFMLAPSCLIVSSTPVSCDGAASFLQALGFDSLTCTPAAGGGCNCSGIVQQTGGLGLLSPAPSTSGNYTGAGNAVALTGDVGDATYDYCISGNKLTLTPRSTSPTVTGTIVLQPGATTGTGGTVGTGGAAGAGVASGTGGQLGSGGATATGGASGSGGAGHTGGAGGQAGKAGSGGAGGSGGKSGTGGAAGSGAAVGPCDIYASAGNPCVAAHSTVRALLGAYSGKLYQVRNTAGATKDILTLAPGGFADGGSQDTFCSGTTCVITVVYDQSGKGNDLWYQGSTMVPGSTSSSPSKATSESLTLSGHKVYSLYINPGNSYWVDASKSGIALGSAPEGLYMVTSGKHYNAQCCFDYGNSETDRKADGSGAMDALNLSAITAWGTGAGSGPWVMADLEYGIFAENNTNKNQNDPTQTSTYVTAVLKNNGTTEFALRGGDATSGALGTYYKGGLPGGWSPMKKQGAIVLGSGGDCCKPGGGANLSDGTFYEGCIVTGYPSDATEDAVQANVVAAGYGR